MHRIALLRACAAALLLLFLFTTSGRAQEATPAAHDADTQILLDAAITPLPSGHTIVEVDRWRMPSGAEPMTLPAVDGSVVVTVESGEIRTSAGSEESHLGAGEWQPFTGTTAISLQPVGDDDAMVFIVFLFSGFEDAASSGQYDTTAYTVDWLVSTSTDDLPSGAGRIVLERLLLPAGSDLPPVASQPLVWTEVGSGALGLTLEGEPLPFRWKSGAERTFRPGQYLPAVSDGVQMTFRNVGANDLILYRLSIVPEVT